MPLALETPQLILMVLSFAGMLGSVGIAWWLWLRQRNTSRADARRSEPHPIATPIREVAPAPSTPEPAPFEPTEFVALPHLREHDAPRDDVTEFIAVSHERTAKSDRTEFVEPPPERTQFVAPPPERTEIVVARNHFAPPPERTSVFVPEKTEFIPLPAGLRDPIVVPPPPARPQAPTPTEIDLPEHLRLAIAAFEQLQAGTPSPALDGHLDVLAHVHANELLELVRPALANTEGLRFAGALLTLLHAKTWPAKTAFTPLLAELDEARRQTALALLRSWDDPRAESIAAGSLAAAVDLDSRVLWLACHAERGWDVSASVIEAALADPNPRIVAQGLRLLPRSDAAPRLRTALAGSLFAADTTVRMHAIEAALAFADPSAWLVCRQLARNPGFPVAAQLVGLLGTEAEIAEQCRAFESAPMPELLTGLGLSGRPIVLRACIDRFDDADPKLAEAARAALTLAAGSSFASASDARTWLAKQSHPRLLGGARRSAAQVLATLATTNEPTRRAFARELRIRSRGRVHLDPTLLPHAFAQQLEQLEPLLTNLDFG